MAELELIKISDIEVEDVDWLWYPYIPYGKLTLIHGNPGDGKTHIALKIAAECSNGKALPGSVAEPPITLIYQTAEDGLGDTIKPRLEEAGADQDKIFVIDEDKQSLSMKDHRIEEAIKRTGAKLIILDPIQAYLGGDIDMNRANEVRQLLKPLVRIAQTYQCAIVLIGHLNKNHGTNSVYRGMGSMDFAATVRSILLVGRYKEDPNIRVLVHDKSSLAPEGPSVGFRLDGPNGFEWLEGYESITSDEVLSSPRNSRDKPVSKLDRAVEFLKTNCRELGSVASNDIFDLAKLEGISERTLKEAKKHIPQLQSVKVEAHWEWQWVEEETEGKEGSKHADVFEEKK